VLFGPGTAPTARKKRISLSFRHLKWISAVSLWIRLGSRLPVRKIQSRENADDLAY